MLISGGWLVLMCPGADYRIPHLNERFIRDGRQRRAEAPLSI
jgi:hypothetical protein